MAAGDNLDRIEELERERDRYRIEADCGLRDYDALELNAGILVEAVEKIAKARPNQTFDPWARDTARHALELFTESMEQTPGPSRAEAAEAALADLRRALESFLAPWGLEHYPQLRRALAAADSGTEHDPFKGEGGIDGT